MKQLKTWLIAAVTVFAFSCKTEQKLTNIIVYVDFSASRDSSIIVGYREAIAEKIIKNMGKKSVLVILPIDKGSLAAGEELFRIDFSKNDYTSVYGGLNADKIEGKKHKDSVLAAVTKFREAFNAAWKSRARFGAGTDIFGGLHQAHDYFVPGGQNLIVIFSDMLQSDNHIDFEKAKNLQPYFDIEEKVDLHGSEVMVVTGIQNIGADTYAKVQKCWIKYFISCKAQVIAYSSGEVSKFSEVLKRN